MGYDQDFLNMRTAEAGIDITWIGEEYNQRNVNDRQWTLANNHILHLVGGGKERLMDYADFLGYGRIMGNKGREAYFSVIDLTP